MRGRPCLTPGHPLTNAERVARWRRAHPKPEPPPKAEEPEEPFQLRTFGELATTAQKPERPPFDPRAMIG